MMKIFNSTFETSIRVLILLDQINLPINHERIVYYDLLACFAKDFGITGHNLHGEDHTESAELPVRRIRIKNALKRLVLAGYILPQEDNVFFYTISEKGRQYVKELSSDYAGIYASTIDRVHARYSTQNNSDLIKMICTRDLEVF